MSFKEKSIWITLVTVVLVYGWYFLNLASVETLHWPDYRRMMLGTVIALVLISVISHVVVAAMAPEEADELDERDRLIDRAGESIAGYFATAAALTGMGMAMFEIDHFFIANTILLGLVLAELVACALKILYYRRGF